MSTLRSLGRWFVPLASVFFILTGLSLLFGLTVPAIILGIIALLAGVFGLLAS